MGTNEEVYAKMLIEFNSDLFPVLSGERVSQMTKTFSDVDALQKLLEEVSHAGL